jgi:LAO/AO transport system kinase
MGDKTRMPRLSVDPKAFVRPTPSGGGLGGVHRNTRETILLCEAAGFTNILVETVGVGQSEFAVASMTDFLVLMLLPNAGDELQGIKRGIVEVAGLVVVNKADSNAANAALARRHYENAIHYLPAVESRWTTPVLTCSALTGENIPAAWDSVLKYKAMAQQNGYFQERRRQQLSVWMDDELRNAVQRMVDSHPAAHGLRAAVKSGEISPSTAAAELLLKLRDS